MKRLATRHRPSARLGLQTIETGLHHLDLALARVPQRECVEVPASLNENLLVVLEAPDGLSLEAGGEQFQLPPRLSVFRDQPSALFVPPGVSIAVTGPALAVIFGARAEGESVQTPYTILPGEVQSVVRGRGNYQRTVRDILPAGRPATRLLAGETINPPGNWSSSPPHKHDRHAPPEETELEELYVFRVDPAQGFGAQLSYTTDPPAEAGFVVHDLDVVAIPAGYHPVVAAPGYSLYYLWCLAGQGRELLWRTDPAHAWVNDQV